MLRAPLLRRVDAELIGLLRELRPDEWDLSTVAPAWKVRDVAGHLLDTVLRSSPWFATIASLKTQPFDRRKVSLTWSIV